MSNIFHYLIPTASTSSRYVLSGAASPTRAVFMGGHRNPNATQQDTVDYIEIMTLGDAQDFGDLSNATSSSGGCSNGHGGLG